MFGWVTKLFKRDDANITPAEPLNRPQNSILFTPQRHFVTTLPGGQQQRYVKGLIYNIRPDNSWLHDRVFEAGGWKQSGLVEILYDKRARARARVKGRVR